MSPLKKKEEAAALLPLHQTDWWLVMEKKRQLGRGVDRDYHASSEAEGTYQLTHRISPPSHRHEQQQMQPFFEKNLTSFFLVNLA